MSKTPRSYTDDAPLTAAELRTAKPARSRFPELVAAHEKGALRKRGQRGPQKAPTKEQVTLRLDRSVLDFYRSQGAGWQSRIGDALRAIVEADR